MKFYKYHGAGNDFIIVEEKISTETIIKLCDRHFGIGADGIIIHTLKDGVPYMDFYNSDGSVAKMCGNGIRCYAHFLDYIDEDNKIIKTLSGDKKIEKAGKNKYRVFMGKAKIYFENKKIDSNFTMDYLNTGADHVVILENNNFNIENIKKCAKIIGDDKINFPDNANVNLVKVIDKDNLEIITHERGVGITLACGTGAVASGYIAYKKGLVNNKFTTKLLGGKLIIEIDEDENLYMTGEAKQVFIGEIEL
ncbi:diaminopimelate epimerase [Oceanivirga salmonicida]|uniref:diaminopimelate epimerase n=1 Tax=Oceanivirga salmonicida TaxID=1769291 RepID=UPI0012E14775|nr:diaminopimelate epimerase [Oceanivirga salmonicida]